MTISSLEIDPASLGESDAVTLPDFASRRRKLMKTARADFDAAGAVLICDPKDICYFTGVREGVSWLIVTEGGSAVVTRHLMIHEVEAIVKDCEVLLPSSHSTVRTDVEHFVVLQLRKRGIDLALIETGKIMAATYLGLAAQASREGVHLQPASRLTERLRAVKDAGELALIRRCAEIADQAFRQLIAGGVASVIGRSERELAMDLERHMISLGADRQGFPETGIIVASGPNSANAHHSPTSRRVAAGEALLIDWGAELSGYRSDMTRTIFPGHMPAFALEAYPVVESSLVSAAKLLRAEAKMGEIDRVARERIVSAGMPEFHYGVGHGVGLDIHEGPWLRAHSEDLLSSDMVTTIEPGIYIPGTGGIRIENLFRILPNGSESLGSLPISMAEMVLG